MLTAVALAAGVALPLFVSNGTAYTMCIVLAFALVGLSLVIVTGVGGQLSLGQFAVAAVGAIVSYRVTDSIGHYPLAFLVAGLVSAAVATVIGLPALRVRGMFLAVTTLGFAASMSWILQQDWAFGDGVQPGRPQIGDTVLSEARSYYYVVLAAFVVGLFLARNARDTGFGRILAATRDNEDAARAFTVPVTRMKLQAFAVAGMLAGLGGAAYGHLQAQLGGQFFPAGASVEVVALTVIGGIGTLAGPLLGALYIKGIPNFWDLDFAGLALLQLGWLGLILFYPSGLAGLARGRRDRLIGFLARRAGLDPDLPPSPTEDRPTVSLGSQTRQPPAERDRFGPLLEVTDLAKHYGGVKAVDGVSLFVMPGETLGLIGPNGAGKTTLFELISGFSKPDAGTIIFDGHDITKASPEARGRLGLIRSFQEAALFPTMTVLETVMVALERAEPTRVLRSLAGVREADRRKEATARDLLSLMGLDGWRERRIGELSTGTRRITEIACLLALEPTLLLLDEPAAGVAQRETEALGGVIEGVKRHLGTTLIVIEHDMPLINELSDRLVAMESGQVIAEGFPDAVQHDPAVVESFLGADVATIERSGVLT